MDGNRKRARVFLSKREGDSYEPHKKDFSSSFLIVNSKVLLIVRLETIFLSSQVPSDERQQQQTTFNRDHDASKLDQRASLLICCANTTR